FEVKALWARVEANAPERMAAAYRPVVAAPAAHPPDTVGRVATLLADTGHPAEGLVLRRHLVGVHRGGEPARLAGALSNLALLLKGRGEADGAVALLAEAEEIYRGLGNRHGLQT